MATNRYNLGQLPWTLTGWTPFEWQLDRSGDAAFGLNAAIPAIPARVPGSVQMALLHANLIPDWTIGLNASACEWVENRHWVFATQLPSEWLVESGGQVLLHAEGLDHAGWIYCNDHEVATFANAFVPLDVDLTPFLEQNTANTLQIIFACPPRWLGQFGATAQMTEWKPRFNYTWDWLPRLVQIGIWDTLILRVGPDHGLDAIHWTPTVTRHNGNILVTLGLHGTQGRTAAARVRVTLTEAWEPHKIVLEVIDDSRALQEGITWNDLPVELWWPNGAGAQPLYLAVVELLDREGQVIDSHTQRLGFKAVNWEPCQDAAEHADPWLCVVNGQPIFLQGVNWTPIRPNFADVSGNEYHQRLRLYRDMGCNVLRVWGSISRKDMLL